MIRSVCVITIALLSVAHAYAVDVGEAKTKGHTCEQTNGYLRATGSAPGDVRALVKDVNAKRKAQYAKIATKNGVEVVQVSRLTAQKLINSAPRHACE